MKVTYSKFPIYRVLRNALKKTFKKYIIRNWHLKGCPVPPPHLVKQQIILEYKQKYGHTIFIETGTYLGDMINAQKKNFSKLISIELSTSLFEQAQKRFHKNKHICIFQGDSTTVLPNILPSINKPAIFWLDGHYSYGITAQGSKDCPIFSELEAIFSMKKNNVILIDDARHFIGNGDYPSLSELETFVKNKSLYRFKVEHDIIRLEP